MAESQDRPADDDKRDGETSDGRPTADDAASTADESTANGDEDSTERDPDDDSAGSTEDAEDDSPKENSADDDSADDDSVEDGPTEDDSDDEDQSDEAPEPVLPPVVPAPFMELLAAYHQPATAGAERLPWSWATLSAGEREASATALDGFVESYNRTWAMNDQQTVPPCWHRHPALAHDLAALAWAYYQAYRDPMATPDRALRFQAHLPRFAERVDRWLGADPATCRDGHHPAVWRASDRATAAPERSTEEDADAVLLLGRETFGFPV